MRMSMKTCQVGSLATLYCQYCSCRLWTLLSVSCKINMPSKMLTRVYEMPCKPLVTAAVDNLSVITWQL